MKVISTITIFLSLLPEVILAQDIRGKVTDQSGENMTFANVVLCQSSDSTVVSGGTTDENGEFSIPCENVTGKYLKISFVGYETQCVPATEVPMQILLSPLVLQEVTVTGHKDLYKQENNEIVAQVKGTVLESLQTANDIIAQLPLVSGQNGDFTVFGKGTPLIYINNRLVRDKEDLNRLMSSEIKSIRINTMPGAKYDASVGSVIQIKTERPEGEGLGGSLYAKAKKSSVWSTEEYASLNYRNKAWDLFGSAYWIQKQEKINMQSQQTLFMPEDTHHIGYEEREKTNADRIYTVVGTNFNPNPQISAGIQYTYDHSAWENNMYDQISHVADSLQENFIQESFFDKPDKSHNINAYYSGQLTDKCSLDINFDWLKGDETDRMNSYFPDNWSDDINSLGGRKYRLYATKGIFSYMGSWLSGYAGTEYSYTDVEQTYAIDNPDLEIDNSNDITRQNRWALFANAQAKINNWGFSAGLRYEDIRLDYYKNNVLNEEQSKNYHKIFPNVGIQYADSKFQASIGYERKIKYPTYGELRSNIQYSTPFVYESGNPMLAPQLQNDFTAMLSIRDFQIMAGYSLYEDYITQLMEQYKEKPVILLHTDNIENAKNRFLVVSYAPTWKVWQPNIEVGTQWQLLEVSGRTYDNPLLNIRFNNTFTFPNDWVINLDTRWQSKGNADIYQLGSIWQMNMYVTKQLFNKKLSITLAGNDLFKTKKTKWHINHKNILFDYEKYTDNRYVSLSIQYNFNASCSKYKGESSSDEINRL